MYEFREKLSSLKHFYYRREGLQIMSSRWQHGSFLTTEEDQLATVHRRDMIMKMPEHRWGEIAPWTTEIKKDPIIRVMGRTTLWLHCPSPGKHKATPERARLGLQFLQWGRNIPKWASTSPNVAGCFPGCPLWSHSSRITGELCRVWLLWIRNKQRRRVDPEQPVLRSWQTTFLFTHAWEQRSQMVTPFG